jgi:hypothetical protein
MTDRGPNGIPYLDPDRSEFGQWESGDYRIRLGRSDGESLNINLRPKHFRALVTAALHHASESDGDEFATVASGSQVEQYDGQPSYVVRVNDVSGFPGTIISDLKRADGSEQERVTASHWYHHHKDESVVLIQALDDNAMKWLYDWLEDTRQYYREEYVDASGEHDAARELADAVYETMSGDDD